MVTKPPRSRRVTSSLAVDCAIPIAARSTESSAQLGRDGLRYCSAHAEQPPQETTRAAEVEEIRAWAEAGLSRALGLEENLLQLAEVVDRLSAENASLRGQLERSPYVAALIAEEGAIARAKAESLFWRSEAERAFARVAGAEAELDRIRRAGLELLLSRIEQPAKLDKKRARKDRGRQRNRRRELIKRRPRPRPAAEDGALPHRAETDAPRAQHHTDDAAG